MGRCGDGSNNRTCAEGMSAGVQMQVPAKGLVHRKIRMWVQRRDVRKRYECGGTNAEPCKRAHVNEGTDRGPATRLVQGDAGAG